LRGLFLQPLAESDKDHSQEHDDGMTRQPRNIISQSHVAFHLRGGRHVKENPSYDTDDQQYNAQYVKKFLHLIFNLNH
jgi:hypothetical protein